MRPIALFALLPLAAFAQTSAPEPAAPAEAAAPAAPAATVSSAVTPAASPHASAWSIGAGVGIDSFVSPVYIQLYSGLSVPPAQVPSVTASLERRLSSRTWLVLGLNGLIARDREDLAPGAAGVSRSDQYAAALTAGVRYVLTPAAAPVDVSTLVLAEGGYTRSEGDAVVYDFASIGGPLVETSFEQTGWRAGANAGIAIDRELTGNLSLRLATPLVAVSYTSTQTRVSGQPTRDGEILIARAVIAPRLELRLAF